MVDVFVAGLCSQVAIALHVRGRWAMVTFVAILAVVAAAGTASPKRATPGMAFAHIRLAGRDGTSDPSWWAVLIRALVAASFGLVVVVTWWGLIPFGLALAVAAGPAGRTAWDLASGTTVVSDWRPGRFR